MNKINQLKKTILKVLILLIIVGVTLSYVRTGKCIRGDGDGYYVQLRSLLIDGDLNYENEYALFDLSIPLGYTEGYRTKTDHIPNKYFIGPALLWSPFIIISHLLALLFSYLGFPIVPNGYSGIYQLTVGLSSTMYGILGLLLLYKFLKIYFSEFSSWLSTLCILLGTNVIYYLTTETSMSHNMSLFSVALFMYWIETKSKHPYYWLFAGLITAIMTLVRPQNILFTIILLPKVIEHIKTNSFKSLSSLVMGGIGFMSLFSLQMIVWKIVFGSFIKYSYSGESFHFTDPKLWKVLFSDLHGLISWTPIVGLALFGVLYAIKKHKTTASLLFICFCTQWYLNASWHCWWFGMSYGNRAFINCSVIFGFGLAFLIDHFKHKRKITFTILTLLVIHNLLFFLAFALNFFDGEGPVSFMQRIKSHYYVLSDFFKKLWDTIG